MMYFDSSALIKRYLAEEGSGMVGDLLNETSVIATSILTYPEIVSAFTRKHRAKDILKDEYAEALSLFEKEWSYFFIIQFSDQFYPSTKKIIEKHGLRAADSIHLASALWLKQSTKNKIAFVASDLMLLKAAHAEKLSVINPQDG